MARFVPRKEPTIPFTKEGYEKVLADKAKLLAERPGAVENLQKAREMGDLSENGYYKAARARLSSIDAHLRRLEKLRRFGVIVESKHDGSIDIGSTVVINDGKMKQTYTVVGGHESDPKCHTISHLSPLGKALIGKRKGEIITVIAPAGTKTYTVETVD